MMDKVQKPSKSEKRFSLPGFTIYHILSLFFSIINSVKEINLYCLPISLFDELPTSQRCVISSFVFKSEFCFVALIRVFQNIAVYANKNTVNV
jgi:hypothetical protein